ncbi:hypothetical protein KAX02_01315 [candidate division WOR-3 bacterium]|nr:hypothetical protein [candidate division WOR-3 bacterium]
MKKTSFTACRRDIAKIILFIFFLAIISIGIFNILILIMPKLCSHYYEEWKIISFLIGLILTSYGFSLYFRQKKKKEILREVLKILYLRDKNLFLKLKNRNFNKNLNDINFALSKILNWIEKINNPTKYFDKIDEISDPIGHFARIDRKNAMFDEAERILLEDLGPYEYVNIDKLRNLQRLENLILDNIPYDIKNRFSPEITALRIKLLDEFFNVVLRKTKLSRIPKFKKVPVKKVHWKGVAWETLPTWFSKEHLKDLPFRLPFVYVDEIDEENLTPEIIRVFFTVVLNKFYSECDDYKKQPVEFDPKLLRKYFEDMNNE